MWRVAFRDLKWRRRRLIISTLGTSLVFTMALVLAGLAGSFGIEAANALKAFGADTWIVHAGTPGPVTGGIPIPESKVNDIGHLPGVKQAGGLIYAVQAIGSGAQASDANLFGTDPGRVGTPAAAQGRQPRTDSEAMIDDALPYGIGQSFEMGDQTFKVVGLLHQSTLLSGTPNVFITVHAAQKMLFGGQALVTAVLTKGTPSWSTNRVSRPQRQPDQERHDQTTSQGPAGCRVHRDIFMVDRRVHHRLSCVRVGP